MDNAHTPNMGKMARRGTMGMVNTIPDGLLPGSDVANLAIMGYDPKLYYTGRAPLEAASMRIHMNPDDVAFRCNLVTLSSEERTHFDAYFCLDQLIHIMAGAYFGGKPLPYADGDNIFAFYIAWNDDCTRRNSA